jgi:hypothetical protein
MCVRSQFFIHIDSEYLRLTTDLALKFLFDHSFVCLVTHVHVCLDGLMPFDLECSCELVDLPHGSITSMTCLHIISLTG